MLKSSFFSFSVFVLRSSSWGLLEVILAHLESLLGSFEVPCGGSLGLLGGHLSALGGCVGFAWGPLGANWGNALGLLEVTFEPLGLNFGMPRRLLNVISPMWDSQITFVEGFSTEFQRFPMNSGKHFWHFLFEVFIFSDPNLL